MLGQASSRLASARQIALPALDLSLYRQLAAALLATALLETLLLRLVTRVGVHLPKDAAVAGVFQVAELLGSVAFNFASLLAIGLAALFLGSLVLRTGSSLGRLALAGLSLGMLGGLALSLATGAPEADALFGLSITLLVGLAGLVLVKQDEMSLPARVALALIVAAYFCYQYYSLSHLAYRLLDYSTVPPLSIAALRLGEGLVVVAGAAVFWAWGLGRWRRLGWAELGLVAVLVLAIALSSFTPSSTMSILALWTTGLSLFLPFPLYLLSLALYLVTLVACWRSGDAFWTAAGLLLLLLAGYMPEATYYHLLLLLGVACLSGAVQRAMPSWDAGEAEARAA